MLIRINIYFSGDDAKLQIDIDNTACKLDVIEIWAALEQRITLKSDCGITKTIYRSIVRDIIKGI